MHFKPDHSIKLAAIFGICISIWTHAKKERFAQLARYGLLENLAGYTGLDVNRRDGGGSVSLLITTIARD